MKNERNQKICDLYLTGQYSMVEVGKQFGLKKQAVVSVIHRNLHKKDILRIKKSRAKASINKRKPKLLQ